LSHTRSLSLPPSLLLPLPLLTYSNVSDVSYLCSIKRSAKASTAHIYTLMQIFRKIRLARQARGVSHYYMRDAARQTDRRDATSRIRFLSAFLLTALHQPRNTVRCDAMRCTYVLDFIIGRKKGFQGFKGKREEMHREDSVHLRSRNRLDSTRNHFDNQADGVKSGSSR